MTIKDLMQQDPREFFGFDDPRAIQEVLADDEPSAGELLSAVDPVTAHDLDALIAKAKERTSDESEQKAFYEQSESFREHLAVTGRQW